MTAKERQLPLLGLPINIFTDLARADLEDDLRSTFQIYILRRIRNDQDPFFLFEDYLKAFGRRPGPVQRKVLYHVFELTESPGAPLTPVLVGDISKSDGIRENEVSGILSRLSQLGYVEKIKEGRTVNVRIADRFMAYALLMNFFPDVFAEKLQARVVHQDLENYYFSSANRFRSCLYDSTVTPLEPLQNPTTF